MNYYQGFSKTEKRILWGATVAGLIILFFLTPYGDEWLDSDTSPITRIPEIGKVTAQHNDTRHRPGHEMIWRKTKKNESVRVGDAIFSGAGSSALVELEGKSQVTIGENSLVLFAAVQNERVANLQSGNFLFKVDGNLKIAIQGKITEINGKGSEIQIFMGKDKKPKLKLLKGEASVRSPRGKNQAAVALNTRDIASLPEPETTEETPSLVPALEPPQAIHSQSRPLEIPILQKNQIPLSYTWKLYDLYHIESQQKDFQLFAKRSLPDKVPLPNKLSWTLALASTSVLTKPAKAFVEIANEKKFTAKMQYTVADDHLELGDSFIGENYWRVSLDGKNWSQIEKFVVDTKFLDGAEPTVELPAKNIPLVSEVTKVSVKLKTPVQNPSGFIVQASRLPNFTPESNRIFWSSRSEVSLTFFKPGDYYYRFQTVTAQQELSSWSKPVKFTVFNPERPAAPRITRFKKEGFIEEDFKMSWQSSGVKTRVEIIDEKGENVEDLLGTLVSWRPRVAGQYQARAWTVNAYGQESSASRPVTLKVKPKPFLAKAAERPKEPESLQKKTQRKEVSVLS